MKCIQNITYHGLDFGKGFEKSGSVVLSFKKSFKKSGIRVHHYDITFNQDLAPKTDTDSHKGV